MAGPYVLWGACSGIRNARLRRIAANSEQHAEKADNYKISMRLGDTIYNCTANAPVQTFMDWTTTKSFPAKLSADGKTLSVKVTSGEIVDMKVKGKKKVG